MRKVAIFLYDYTGLMAEPWLAAGYECWLFDGQHQEGITREGNLFKVGMWFHHDQIEKHAADIARMVGEVVVASEYDAAQAQLAALREACAKEFESVQTLDNENSVLKQRLADAERRNAEVTALLGELYETVDFVWAEVEDLLNPKPEAASHDE